MKDYGGRKAKSFAHLIQLVRRDFPADRADRMISMMQNGATYDDAVYATGKVKRNPHTPVVPDEGPTEHLRNAAAIIQAVLDIGDKDALTADDARAVLARIKRALLQLEDLRVYMGLPRKPNRRSVRRASNPALAVLGNPRVEDATIATWAKIEYMRPDDPDGSDVVRVHEFKDGFEIGWLSDGSVQLRHPKHPLWMDDEED